MNEIEKYRAEVLDFVVCNLYDGYKDYILQITDDDIKYALENNISTRDFVFEILF